MSIRDDRADKSESVEDLTARMQRDGVEIEYGDIKVLVMAEGLISAREWVAKFAPEEREGLRESVSSALDRALPLIERGEFSKEAADEFYGDLLLWTALKEYGLS